MRPDALAALCHYMEAQAVSSARIIEVRPELHALRFRAGDGAEAWIVTDRYGTESGWSDTRELAEAQLVERLAARQSIRYEVSAIAGIPTDPPIAFTAPANATTTELERAAVDALMNRL